ncbi:MAG: choice-of-anchor tandem repeat GloVer-containing protein, partial [Candidatus Sulfotelmatobacter sp.]
GTLGYNGYFGTLFKITPSGELSILYDFDGTTGQQPQATLMQATNGLIYGDANHGGVALYCECGTFFSFDAGLAPFIRLISTSGKAGKQVEILGQNFTGAVSVSFNATPATFRVQSDSFLTATVPTGATTGYVIVTTPKGSLTSSRPFRVVTTGVN